MFDVIKEKIWDLLKEKDVSLVMLYDLQGNILWHKGRTISGKTIRDGEGFSKTYIRQAFIKGEVKAAHTVVLGVNDHLRDFSSSAQILHIKSILINRINGHYFLYVDSGTKNEFTHSDCQVFNAFGRLMGDTIRLVKKNEADFGGIIGSSSASQKIRDLVIKYSITKEPVLLMGETGTGKTHIANLLHSYSGRKGKLKIINSPGIPESLFESEMFGHTRGAFTDAKSEKKGLVEEARSGTLFIDEITEVSYAVQAKLLRFIETGKYNRLGETTERQADVRIVAASNKNLQQAIDDKEFREDLYYRLNVFEIEIPPLRKRIEDIKALVEEKKRHLMGKKFGKGFWEALYQHQWPGNVRELISVLKRAALHHNETIEGCDIKDIINSGAKNRNAALNREKDNQLGNIYLNHPQDVDRIWQSLSEGRSFWEEVKKPFLARDLKRSEVKAIVSMGLEQSGGKYKNLLKIFNLETTDYHRFMRFLHEQDLKPFQ